LRRYGGRGVAATRGVTEEIPEGQHRVLVNLDSLEYIDPVKFGQVPSLAGMLANRGPPPWPKPFEKADPRGVSCIDVAGALFAMLCHSRRRGGGDLPANVFEERAGWKRRRPPRAVLLRR
jgi:hypothetical protein